METGSAFCVGGLRENIVANPLALWDDLTRFVDVNTDRSDRALNKQEGFNSLPTNVVC